MWEGSVLDGVFAQAGEIFDGTQGLAFVLNARGCMTMLVLQLDQASLESAIEVSINGDGEAAPALATEMRSVLPRLVSLVLYLCSEAPELGGGTSRPVRPRPKRTHRGARMMPARRPVMWEVGTRLAHRCVRHGNRRITRAGTTPHADIMRVPARISGGRTGTRFSAAQDRVRSVRCTGFRRFRSM
ncbi:protein of unknown function [Paraburkholderia kururiensis]